MEIYCRCLNIIFIQTKNKDVLIFNFFSFSFCKIYSIIEPITRAVAISKTTLKGEFNKS